MTIECDPGTFDRQKLDAYRSLGVNRVSLGVQSFDDGVLRLLHRSHSARETRDSLELLARAFPALDRVSCDLLINLPELGDGAARRAEDLETQLRELADYAPGHVSVYSLQVEPESYFYDRLRLRQNEGPLPSLEEDCNSVEFANAYLQRRGYRHYEVSSYCRRPEFAARHNEMYWRATVPFFGFGMGASSLLRERRFRRPRQLAQYFRWVEADGFSALAQLGELERGREKLEVLLMGQLRTEAGLNLRELRTELTAPDIDRLLARARAIEADQHVFSALGPDTIALSMQRGYLLCDQIAYELLQALAPPSQ